MATQMKGTFFFKLGSGGFSESLYNVVGDSITYSQMMQKMKDLLPWRTALSITGNSPGGHNPAVLTGIECSAIRVEDELQNKDSLTDLVIDTTPGFPLLPPPANPLFSQNLNQNVAAKLQWNGASTKQQAVTFLHGIPIAGADDDINNAAAISTLNDAPMSAVWLNRLRDYGHAVRLKGVGFRYLNSPWTTTATAPTGIPISVTYDAAHENYVLEFAQAPIKPRTRYVLRGFKSLRFLNGRWPGIDIGTNKVRILRKARSDAWDQEGTAVPEVWNYFQPNETSPEDPNLLPGVKYFFLTTKKIGRPFGLPRGRQRARAT